MKLIYSHMMWDVPFKVLFIEPLLNNNTQDFGVLLKKKRGLAVWTVDISFAKGPLC
jgi:hypothetical protein